MKIRNTIIFLIIINISCNNEKYSNINKQSGIDTEKTDSFIVKQSDNHKYSDNKK